MELIGVGVTMTLTDEGVECVSTSFSGKVTLGTTHRLVPYSDVIALRFRERTILAEGNLGLRTDRGRTQVVFRPKAHQEAARFFVELCLRCPQVVDSSMSGPVQNERLERMRERTVESQAKYEALVAKQAATAAERKAQERLSVSDQLLQLAVLRGAGMLTEEEFDEALLAILPN